jgi:hypothetical protein
MSDIIYTPPASGGGGGTTINPTNNVLPVRSNATTFVDSFIFNDNSINVAYSSPNLGIDIYGWYVDLATGYTILGDYGGIFDQLNFWVDSNTSSIYSRKNGNEIGLKLDFTQQLYSFGDFNSVSSGVSFYIDEANSTIYTQHSGQQEGLFFDFVNDYFSIGDFGNTNNGTYLKIDDDNLNINTFYAGNNIGLNLVFANSYYQLGDFGNLVNYNYLIIDDLNNSIFLGNGKGDQSGLKYQYYNSSNDCLISLGSSSDGIGFGCNFDTATITNSFLYLNSYYDLILSSSNNASTTILAFGTNTNQLVLDPSSDKMSFTTNNLNFVGASLIDANIVAPVAKNLLVTINGTIYHIPLYN